MYLARFTDTFHNSHTRRFKAKHREHARMKALGIARSNGWMMIGEPGVV